MEERVALRGAADVARVVRLVLAVSAIRCWRCDGRAAKWRCDTPSALSGEDMVSTKMVVAEEYKTNNDAPNIGAPNIDAPNNANYNSVAPNNHQTCT